MASVSQKIVGIYKITNLINGMCYVGQSTDIERRKNDHLSNYADTHNDYFSKAIKKYGSNNFGFEILEHCNVDKLDKLERKYISKYNSIFPNGYNFESGGCSQKKLSQKTKRKIGDALSRPVHQYSIDGKYIKTFKSAQTVAELTNNIANRSNIQMVCLGKKKTSLGFQWRYADEYDKSNIKPLKTFRREKGAKISQYTKSGKFIKTYSSRLDVEKETGISAKNIFYGLSYGKTAGKFIWKYEEPQLI